MSSANLQEIFGSDSDSDNDTAAHNLKISPAPEETAEHEDKSGSEAGGTTPVLKAESDGDDDDNVPPAHPTSGYRVPSDVEDETNEESQNHLKGTGDAEDEGTPTQGAAENEAEPEDDEEIRIEAAMQRLEPNFEGKFYYWKVQDTLQAESEDFVADNDDEFEDFEEEPSPDVQQLIRQKVKTTMRWRWNTNEDGQRVPESNTKFVRWSDGSASIVVGSEYYDVSFIPLKGEHHQLFLRQGTGLQGGVVFKEKMTIRPAVANPLLRKPRPSAGPTVAKADDLKSRRTNYMNEVVDKDPEKHRADLMKKEEEKLKATIKKEGQTRRIRERYTNRGVNSGFLEGEEEDDGNTFSVGAIKNAYKRGEYMRPVYSDDEESVADTRRKKLETAKDVEEDDDDDDFGVKKKKTDEGAAKKRVALIDDDESD